MSCTAALHRVGAEDQRISTVEYVLFNSSTMQTISFSSPLSIPKTTELFL